jgi:hypothetical protein
MIDQVYLKKMLFIILGIATAFILNACSISDSSGSISDSSGSLAKSSESISGSSTGDKEKSKPSPGTRDIRYESEVQDFTVTYLRTNSTQVNQNAFMKGISNIASDNGIVDWEANPKTYRAIGKGLKKSRISDIQYDFYKKKFGNNDLGKMDDIQDGYDSKN